MRVRVEASAADPHDLTIAGISPLAESGAAIEGRRTVQAQRQVLASARVVVLGRCSRVSLRIDIGSGTRIVEGLVTINLRLTEDRRFRRRWGSGVPFPGATAR